MRGKETGVVENCPNCGYKNIGAGEMFCPACGEALFAREVEEQDRVASAPDGGAPGPSLPYGANARIVSEGYASQPRQVSLTREQTRQYSRQVGKSWAGRLVVVAAFAVFAALTCLGISYAFHIIMSDFSMELSRPEGWVDAGSDMVENAEDEFDATVDYFYLGGQDDYRFIIGYHHAPFTASSALYGLPDTRDVEEMESFISNNRDEMWETFSDRESGKVAVIKAWQLGCGKVALGVSGQVFKAGKSAYETLLFFKSGSTQYEVMIVGPSQEEESQLTDYVTANLTL